MTTEILSPEPCRFNIVLVEPEIPQNTGNIARSCAVTGSRLHLVGPMGFKIDDAKLRRAGLDYWHMLDITHYDSLDQFTRLCPGHYILMTTKGRCYTDFEYPKGAYLIFGKETAGLPAAFLAAHNGRLARIPQVDEARSLNLSNAVAVALFEALRRHGFPGMKLDHTIKDTY